jgi:hypothetical protein
MRKEKAQKYLQLILDFKRDVEQSPNRTMVSHLGKGKLPYAFIKALFEGGLVKNNGTTKRPNIVWTGIEPNIALVRRLYTRVDQINYNLYNSKRVRTTSKKNVSEIEVVKPQVVSSTPVRKPFIQAIINVMTKTNNGNLNISLIGDKITIQTNKVNFTTTDAVLFEEILNTIA